MGMLERLSDARGTLEGKIVAVVLAILLVLPVATVTAFAGDQDGNQVDTGSESTQTTETVIEEVPDQGSMSVTKTEEAQTPTPDPETSVPETSTTPEATTPEETLETPVVEEEALDAVLALNLDQGATVLYNGNVYTVYSDEMKVPANQDTVFAVGVNDGFKIAENAPVSLVAFDGSETELMVDANGLYAISPDQVAQGLVLQVHTMKVDVSNVVPGGEGAETEEESTADSENLDTEEIIEESAAFATTLKQGDVEVSFNANGGNGTTPESVFADKGEKVIIPEATTLTRTNFELRGWAEIGDANLIDGENPKLIPIYKAGDNYEITQETGKVTLYAVWQQVSGSSKGRIVITLLKRGLPSPPEPAIVQDEEFYRDYDWDGKNAQGTNMRDVLFNTEEGWTNMNSLIKTEAGREELKTKWANVDNILDYMNPVFTTTGATSVNGILTPKFWALVNDRNATKKLWDPKTEHVEFYAVKYQSNTLKYHIDGMIVPNDYALLAYEANADNIQGSLPSNKQFQLFDGKASGTVADPATDGNMSRLGHVFAGWNTKADGTGVSYAAGDPITFTEPGTVTLYAQWMVQYGVSYAWTGLDPADKFIDPNDNQVFDIPTVDAKYLEGSKYVLDTHHKPGDIAYAYVGNSVVAAYIFSGWKLDGKLADSTVTVKSDLKFVGEWTKISYSGTVSIEGREYSGGAEYTQTIETAFCDPNGITTDVGTPSYVYKDKDGNVLKGAPSDAGTYTITAIWPATSTHPEVASKPCSFVISPKPVTLLSASDKKTFDGAALKAERMETMEGFVEGQGIDITYTGERTNSGATPNTYDFVPKDGTNLDNYSIPEGAGTIGNDGFGICTGTLTIEDRDEGNKIPIELVAASSRFNTYDGTIKSVSGLASITAINPESGSYIFGDPSTASFQYGANTYKVSNFTVGVSAIDAGEHPTTFSTLDDKGFIVKDVQGDIVTEQFKVSTENGMLEITPRIVTLNSQTKTKVFDGKPLQAAKILSVDSVLDREATVVATGTITNAFDGPDGKGTIENTIAEPVQKTDAAEGANPFKLSNYIINKNPGKLTILPQSIDPEDNKGKDPSDPDAVYKGVEIGELSNRQYNGNADDQKPSVKTKAGVSLAEDTGHGNGDYTLAVSHSNGNSGDRVNAGTVTFVITGKGNYEGNVERTYQITPAPTAILVADNSKDFDTPDPTPVSKGTIVTFDNASNEDFEKGHRLFHNAYWDKDDSLGTVSYLRDNAGVEKVDTYPEVLTATVSGLNSNYQQPRVIKGAFTINAGDAAGAKLVASNTVKTYDATGGYINVSVEDGWTLQYSTDKGDSKQWSSESPISDEDVGVYTVYVKATRAGYNEAGPVSATVTINPAPVTITVNDATKVAGTDNPEFTGKVEGEVTGHELTGVNYFRKSDSEAVGTYADDLTTSFDENGNYKVSVVEGDFTITPMAVPATPPTPPAPGPFETLVNTVADFLATPIIGPGGIAAAGAADVADENIADADNPLAQIEDDGTPMGAFDHPICWVHYYILLGIIITAIYGGGVIARRLGYNHTIKKYEDDVTGKGEKSEPLKKPVAKEGMQPTI